MNHAAGYEEYAFIADLYDYVVPYRNRPDVSFFVEAAVAAEGPVLEVGCGTGRVLDPDRSSWCDNHRVWISQLICWSCLS